MVDEFPHRVIVRLLGGVILVRCRHAEAAAGVSEYLSAAVEDDPWRTPDVIVDIEWEQAGRYLFRARPESDPDQVLHGVRVHARGWDRLGDWPSHHPPLPPLAVEPFSGRFVALHAGAVELPGRGVVGVLGEKGAGKTTVSVDLVNNHGGALLTDEVLFLHRRTAVVEPFPRSVGLADAYDHAIGRPIKRPQSAEIACREIATRPGILQTLAVMDPDPGFDGVEVRPLEPNEVLRHLLTHQLHTPTRAGEAVATFAELSRQVRAVHVRHGGYATLPEVAERLAAFDAAGVRA